MTEPKSTDRSALVGRLLSWADQVGRKRSSISDNDPTDKATFGSEEAVLREAAALIESPPAGEIQGLVERLMNYPQRMSCDCGELMYEAAEAITRLSQPSGEEIREAAAKIADAEAEKCGVKAMTYDKSADEWNIRHHSGGRYAASHIAKAIRALPLSSGSNKSDDGKKGQPG